jgi:eukaryotic-like serine/threonine-protein kinase
LAGRYTVLHLLGQGGMGMVLAAYDARLDRRVALKLLRSREERGGEGEARMAREAHAMARLNHPHVVAVYDAGTLEDGAFFLAMEYVEGQTLRRWRQPQTRSWREILEAYVAAGRGLAAAHAVGIIHRDFKPDNVLVGQDGRVRVTDFGLAREDHALAEITPVSPLLASPQVLSAPLTVPGTVMGTPAYMAPEVLRGNPADVRCDVYAFSVALYEALYGQLPYPGKTLGELLQAHQEGRLRPAPESTEVPEWVRRALIQGLEADAARRPASLDALLEALEADPGAKRRTRVQAGAWVAGVGVLAALAAVGWMRQHEPACSQQEKWLEGVWDAAVKAKVHQALKATGVPYAPDTLVRVSQALDQYAGAWVKQRAEVCEEMRGQGAQPQGLAVRREYCLERRRSQLRALTGLMSRAPDKTLLPKAVQAVQSLSPLEYCADAQALMAAVPPPEDPAVRARAETIQEKVDQLEALWVAGQYTTGLALGEDLLEQTKVLGHAPLQAQVLYFMAALEEGAGDYKGAEERAHQALAVAAAGKDLQLLARTWSHLEMVVGDRQGRIHEALLLAPAAEVAVELAQDDRVRADWLNSFGNVLLVAGRYEEARQKYEQALALRKRVLGPEHPDVAYSGDNLAQALVALGRNEAAKETHERVLALREKILGVGHPYVAASLNNLGNALVALGQYEEAKKMYERSLALHEQTLGPDHPSSAVSLSNVGITLGYLGRCEEAKETSQRAMRMMEQALGPEHSSVAHTVGLVGDAFSCLGRYEEAKEAYERALTLTMKAWGPDHPQVSLFLTHLGSALSNLGRYEEAKEKHERALRALEQALGPGHLDLTIPLERLGHVSMELGHYEEAQVQYERALRLKERIQGPQHPELASALLGLGRLHLRKGSPAKAFPLLERALSLHAEWLRAEVQFELAQALWMSNKDRERAVQLVAPLQKHWKHLGHAPQLTKVSQWLAVHTGP